MLRMPLLWVLMAATLATSACGGGSGRADSRVFADYGDQLDLGPLPWFREAGCGGDGSGPCGDASSAPPFDLRPPDRMPPDQCVPPTSCTVTFSLARGSESTAALAGDFNSWSQSADPMTLSGSTWERQKVLSDGKRVLYKFVLDGTRWIRDPQNPSYTQDGNQNSILDVKCLNPCADAR